MINLFRLLLTLSAQGLLDSGAATPDPRIVTVRGAIVTTDSVRLVMADSSAIVVEPVSYFDSVQSLEGVREFQLRGYAVMRGMKDGARVGAVLGAMVGIVAGRRAIAPCRQVDCSRSGAASRLLGGTAGAVAGAAVGGAIGAAAAAGTPVWRTRVRLHESGLVELQ